MKREFISRKIEVTDQIRDQLQGKLPDDREIRVVISKVTDSTREIYCGYGMGELIKMKKKVI